MKHNTKNSPNQGRNHSVVNVMKGKIFSFPFNFRPISLIVLMLLGSTLSWGQLSTNDFNFSGALTSNAWVAHSGGGTNPISTTAGLTYAGFPGSGIGNAALVNNLGGEDDNILFANQNTNGQDVFYSCLVNVTDVAATKTGDYLLHIGGGGTTCTSGCATFTAFAARLFVKITASGVNFGISNTSTATYGTTNFARNTTYLVIVKYTLVTGAGTDPLSLWVIPSGVPATEAAAGVAELVNTTTAGIDAINAVALRQGSATTSVQTVVDGIRVGTTWASVTASASKLVITSISPASPVVNTAFSVTVQSQSASSNPTNVLTNTTVNLSVLTGTGSIAGGTLSGVLASGTNTLTLTGVQYSVAETGVVLSAADGTTSLTTGSSTPFDVTAPASALIIVTGTLTPFTTVAGTPSASQSYTVSGTGLTNDILITPPANFEARISPAGVYSAAPFSVVQSPPGTVATTTIDVRYNPSVAGSTSDNVVNSSSPATSQNIAVSGTSTSAEPTVQSTLTFSPVSIHSMVLSFTGGNGASRIVVVKEASAVTYAPADGFASTGVNSIFTSATDQGLTGNRIVYDGTGNTVTVTGLNASTVYHVAVFEYNGTGATANYLSPATAPAIGNTTTLALSALPIPVPMSIQPGLSFTETFSDEANWADNFDLGIGSEHWTSIGPNITGTIPDGIKTTGNTAVFNPAAQASSNGLQRGSLSGLEPFTPFGPIQNVPGTIVLLSTGTQLTNACAIDFHVNFTGVGAGTLSFDWAAVTNSTGDKPSSLKIYTSPDGITFTELTGAAVIDKANGSGVSGSIVNVVLPATLNGVPDARIRFYEYSGPGLGTAGSRAKISIDNVKVTATTPPTKLVVTTISPASPTQNAGFSVTVQSQDASNIPTNVITNTDVSLTLNTGTGLLSGTLTGTILAGTNNVVITGVVYNTIESGVSVTATRTSGDVLTAGNSAPFTVISPSPVITLTGTLLPFLTGVGTQSASQSYTVKGDFLQADILITPPANFEVRTGANAFSASPITIVQSPLGTVATTTIDVRYAPGTAGPHSDNITHTSLNATTQNEAVSGTTVAPEPTTASTVTFGCSTLNSIIVNFTGGNGSSRIVVIRAGGAVTFAPADFTTYSGVNSDYSLATFYNVDNKIVYDGNGSTVTVTNLSSSTQYFVDVYEYNGTGAITNYLTSPFGTGNKGTLGQASYSLTGGTYNEDFNGLPSTGTFSLTGQGLGPFLVSACPINASNADGWQFGKATGAPGGTGTNVVFTVSNGGTAGSVYSYGNTSNTDRALGTLASGAVISSLGLAIKNNTADVLRTISIAYIGEQWRDGGSGNQNTLAFSYSLNGTGILSGTYTPVAALNFVSPVSSLSAGANLNGDVSPNRSVVSTSFELNDNWLPGQTLILKWVDANEGGSDDGLAIDDFSFSALPPSTPTVQDNNISFSSISTTTLTASWLNGDGSNHLVKMNTTNSFTDPSDFTDYPANSVWANTGEQVVYNGTGTSVGVSNLASGPSGTLYYFRVYGFNGTGASAKYLTTTAVLNPNSVTTLPTIPPTQLVFISVNGGVNPIVNQGFSVVIESQDGSGNPQPVAQNTTVNLTPLFGGSLATGNTSGIILAGTSTVTITGVKYDSPQLGVQLNAARSTGDVLSPGQSATFDVMDVADELAFDIVPLNGVVNTVVGNITVNAVRPDLTTDINYSGSVTLSVNSGPGTISGTLIQPVISGTATFNNIQFSAVGAYTLLATAPGLTQAISVTINITQTPVMTELVVPRFMGSKSTASGNTTRTPIAVCLQIDNLIPSTAYDIRVGLDVTSDGIGFYGAGTFWNSAGAAYNNSNIAAFTTDALGGSGPFWIYCLPSGNASNFSAGQIHTVRLGYVVHGAGNPPSAPNFIGTQQIEALDIAPTALTITNADDGAFLTGITDICSAGKYVLVYDNEAGTGRPLYSYQARQAIPVDATPANYSGLPVALQDIYMQSGTSVVGEWPAVIPIGAINPNGVKRIELRNTDNTFYKAETDADGVWPSGANTLTNIRRSVTVLTSADAPFSCGVAVNLKLFIEGYIDAFNHMQPCIYNASQFGTNYHDDPSLFDLAHPEIPAPYGFAPAGVYGPDDCDLVTVSALSDDGSGNATFVQSQTGMLHTDGSLSVTFTSPVSAGTPYWIRITHRNALETWSVSPQMFPIPVGTPYDFSSNYSSVYDYGDPTYPMMHFVVKDPVGAPLDGNWALLSGDIYSGLLDPVSGLQYGIGYQDGNIDGLDYPEWDFNNSSFFYGYLYPDFNGDLNIDPLDFPYWDFNNQSFSFTQHPAVTQ